MIALISIASYSASTSSTYTVCFTIEKIRTKSNLFTINNYIVHHSTNAIKILSAVEARAMILFVTGLTVTENTATA